MTVRSEGSRVRRAIAVAVLTLAAGAAAAKERVVQLAEDTAVRKRVEEPAMPLRAAPPTRVCEPGAQWIRLGFKELVLDGYDSLVVTSSQGDSYTFEGRQWNDRAFHMRALRGDCVDIYPYFGDRDSRYAIDGYEAGTLPLAESTVVVAGAGDICDSSGNACAGTSDLIVNINPTAVFTAGDNAYSNGTLAEYNNRYAPTWGRFKALTSPSPGNHDYNTTNASGYFDYFNGVGVQTGPAGDRSKGYYSWDVGDWHFIALNTMSGGTVATTQVNWLKADLAANTKPCTAAYFHHPLVSRGNYSGYSQVKPFWDALYAAKADLVLVGHDHNYQRYGKMNPSQAAASDGIRQVLVGTGGRAFYGLSGTHPLLEKSNANTWGVLKLTLTATGYTGDFVPRAGGTFTDTFSGTCNKGTPPANLPPTANFSVATNALTATFTDTSTDSDGTIASRAWTFGDGTTSTATNPAKTYAAAGTYTVGLTVTDDDGATNATSRSVTVTASGVQTYTNTADYAINDNATVESPIAVSGRTGNAPTNAQVSIAIVHTYIGDLKVDLVAPDGSLYNLHNRTGGGTDNINKTVTLNLSSEALNGTWKLRVNDNANQDVGKIDSWSVTF
ncbi:proprotein convertase P-domain-containing protein [Tahibacter soli]|uniref:Proprotein convertase P-domain-containing protein n=1 Tax=Tahibacter soli TaxID=2983605 RepID=A0A9X4BJD7_9GAMM|nr:proprotein convertase P-domain-containing protein [Tahibacter soli]MDC8014533.1 proprotein convertase P-domain-containing protein [Tahibacter soli]